MERWGERGRGREGVGKRGILSKEFKMTRLLCFASQFRPPDGSEAETHGCSDGRAAAEMGGGSRIPLDYREITLISHS